MFTTSIDLFAFVIRVETLLLYRNLCMSMLFITLGRNVSVGLLDVPLACSVSSQLEVEILLVIQGEATTQPSL